jgi:Uma2 family endonuclease
MSPKQEELILPRRRLWTRADYERATQLGLFGPEERLELIEGEIIEKMPQNEPHSTGIQLGEEAMRAAFPQGHCVRVQLPLALNGKSMPEPDIAVVTGAIRDYAQKHPRTALLIIEVADSTLAYDRTTKGALYARAGIAEFWILNLIDRVLEVYRQPGPMAGRPLGHYYRSVVQYTETDSIAPLAAPAHVIAVASLLP